MISRTGASLRSAAAVLLGEPLERVAEFAPRLVEGVRVAMVGRRQATCAISEVSELLSEVRSW